eukprot:4722615-Amphidinium_carterae.1
MRVPVGKLKKDPPPMTSDELRSLLTACLALIDPHSYLQSPSKKQKSVQFEAEQLHKAFMPRLAAQLDKLSLERQGAQQ